jgi:hypothetical protein
MSASDCGVEIIRKKDSMHQDWDSLQKKPGKMSVGMEVLLDKNMVDEVVRLAEEAIEVARNCPEKQPDVTQLADKLEEVRERVRGFGKTHYYTMNFYTMTPPEATDFIIQDINQLINYAHNIGASLVEIEGNHGGCGLEVGTNLKAVNEGTLAYCEGVPSPSWHGHEFRAQLSEGGQRVVHRMGAHRNDIWVTEGPREKGWDIKIKYQESGDTNWTYRQDAVKDVLQDQYGLKCGERGESGDANEGQSDYSSSLAITCKGNLRDMQKLREIAFFMSSLSDVDYLQDWCIEDVVQRAAADAVEVVKEHEIKTFTQKPRSSSLMKNGRFCGNENEEREEEEEEERSDRLEGDIRWMSDNIMESAEKVPSGKCSIDQFEYVDSILSQYNSLDYKCRRHKEQFDWKPDACFDLDERMNEINEAAGRLVEGCKPEKFLPSFMAQYATNSWYLNSALHDVKKVCRHARGEAGRECEKQVQAALNQIDKGEFQTVLGQQPAEDMDLLKTNAAEAYNNFDTGRMPSWPMNERQQRTLEQFGMVHPWFDTICKVCGHRYGEHWGLEHPTDPVVKLKSATAGTQLGPDDILEPWNSKVPHFSLYNAMPTKLKNCMGEKLGIEDKYAQWVPYYQTDESFQYNWGLTIDKQYDEVKSLWHDCLKELGFVG